MFVGGETFDEDYNKIKLNSVTMIQSDSAKYCFANISEVGSDLAAYASGNAGKDWVFHFIYLHIYSLCSTGVNLTNIL
jgi:hypothetical protein